MEKNSLLLKILFCCSLASAATLVGSGSILFVQKITGDKTKMLKQVTFTGYNETHQVESFEASLLPSETASYHIDVKSNLVENCKYSISFKNHKVTEEDKMFYVSIYTETNPYLMNNTLSEIFTEGLSVVDQVLPSFKKETVYFDFTIDKDLSNTANFDFDIVFTSEGKLTY